MSERERERYGGHARIKKGGCFSRYITVICLPSLSKLLWTKKNNNKLTLDYCTVMARTRQRKRKSLALFSHLWLPQSFRPSRHSTNLTLWSTRRWKKRRGGLFQVVLFTPSAQMERHTSQPELWKELIMNCCFQWGELLVSSATSE